MADHEHHDHESAQEPDEFDSEDFDIIEPDVLEGYKGLPRRRTGSSIHPMTPGTRWTSAADPDWDGTIREPSVLDGYKANPPDPGAGMQDMPEADPEWEGLIVEPVFRYRPQGEDFDWDIVEPVAPYRPRAVSDAADDLKDDENAGSPKTGDSAT